MSRKRQDRQDQQAGASDSPRAERLQKVLAAAGVGSRRDCEEMIVQGRITVDRQIVTELGTRVDPLQQEIRVDGEALRRPQRLYYVVNKPVGVVSTSDDPAGRTRVIDLVPTEERVFAVGRLDRSSEGLILVTNDGEFANRITHPRYGVEKTYAVRVAGAAEPKQLARLKKGVHLAEGFAKAQAITVKRKHGQSTDLVIVLNEGRNREVRRILARVGHKVLALKRIAVGPIKLADLPVGAWRRLMPNEVELLLSAAQEKRRAAKRGSGVGGRASEEKSKVQGSKFKVAEEQYVQKAALLAEPLSLDDLLRDDLDEANVGGLLVEDAGTEVTVEEGGELVRADVIDYPDEAPPPPVNAPRQQPERGKFQKQAGGKRDRGKRVGDKRVGDKRAGDKRIGGKRGGGKPGFRAKHARTGKNFQQKQRRGKRDGQRKGRRG